MVEVLAVIGSNKSGKTSTVEYLVSKLTERGLRVGSAKHVHHPDFTIDLAGKDTWRHSKAGARRVVCLAEDEVTVIRKERGPDYTLEQLVGLFQDETFDLIVLEGFHWLVSKRTDIAKIVTAKDVEDAEQRLNGTSQPIIAITGRISNEGERTIRGIPVIHVETDGDRLSSLVAERIRPVTRD